MQEEETKSDAFRYKSPIKTTSCDLADTLFHGPLY